MGYDSFARFYDTLKTDDDYERLFNLLHEAYTPFVESPHTAWDIGAGTGLFSEQLANSGTTVLGSDSSAGMIAEAKAKNVKNCHFVVSDVTKEKPQGKFQLITAIDDVFNCIDTREKIRRAFLNIKSALTKDGVLLFDLVGKAAFTSYMTRPMFRENSETMLLAYPGHEVPIDFSRPLVLHCDGVTFTTETRRWVPFNSSVTEYFYEPALIEEIISECGLEIREKHLLSDGKLRPLESSFLADDAYKIVYLIQHPKYHKLKGGD